MQTSLRGLCAIAFAGWALAGPALTACTPAKPAEPAAPAPATPAAAAPGPIAFSINITLSKMAADKMAKDGDQVRVSATYYGTAKSSGVGPADLSRVPLGDEEKAAAPASQVMHFSGAYDVSGAKSLEGEPRVLINAVSTDIDRGRYPMECTAFDGALKEAAALGAAGVPITCKAFGEP